MVDQQNLSDAGLVLGLAIDRVLNQEDALWNSRRGIHMCPKQVPGHSIFEWLPIFDVASVPFSQVGLVLSSTWCFWPGFGKTLKRFPPVMRRRFVKGTFHKRVHGTGSCVCADFQEMTRGQQAWQDVQRRKSSQWLTSVGEHVWQRWLAIDKVADAVHVANEVLAMRGAR